MPSRVLGPGTRLDWQETKACLTEYLLTGRRPSRARSCRQNYNIEQGASQLPAGIQIPLLLLYSITPKDQIYREIADFATG
jgi:hypothetical protein